MPEPSRAWSWFKVSVRVLTDPKVMKAARRAGPSVHGVLLWALSTNAAGGHEGEIPLSDWDAETVAVLIGCDGDGAEVSGADQAQRAFDELARSGFMVLDGESIMLPAWSKWRPESSSTDRVRAWRERQAAQKHDETLRNVTSVSVTQEERRGEESGEEEKRETTRARTRGVGQDQDHQLTDATRTNLDADARRPPPDTAATPQHPQTPPDTDALKAATEVLDHWRDLRAAEAPSDRTVTPDAWPLKRDPLAMRLVDRVRDKGRDALIRALDHGWLDRGDGKRWPGWHSKLATAEKALIALTESELVDQAADAQRAKAEAAKREREGGNGRRSNGPEPPDYAAITRDREAYERKMRAEYEAAEKARPPARRGGEPQRIGAVLRGVK